MVAKGCVCVCEGAQGRKSEGGMRARMPDGQPESGQTVKRGRRAGGRAAKAAKCCAVRAACPQPPPRWRGEAGTAKRGEGKGWGGQPPAWWGGVCFWKGERRGLI